MTVADQYFESRRAFVILSMRVKLPNRRASRASWRRTITCETGTRRFTTLRGKVPHPPNSFRLRSFGASGTAAGLCAHTDSARGIWNAPPEARPSTDSPSQKRIRRNVPFKCNLLFKAGRIAAVVVAAALCLLSTVGCGDGNSVPITKSLVVSPGTLALSTGVPGQIKVVGTFDNGEQRDLTAIVTWEETDVNVASVSSRGTVMPLAVGQTTIRAKYGSMSASVQVRVLAASLTSLSISPSAATLPLGKGTRLFATGTFSDNSTHDVSGSVIWSSTNPTVAVVAQDGQLRSNAVGTAAISAAQGKIASSTNVTISDAALASIVISADSATLAIGRNAQLKAQGIFTDGTSRDITNTVTWSSSSPNIVAITPGGVAQAKGVGTANVIAALGAVSGAQALTATAAALNTITVSSSQSLLRVGTTTQLTASGTYSDGSTQDLTASVRWSSSSPNIVAITPGGVAQAKGVGTANVIAALGEISGTQALTATAAALNTITVSSSQALLPVGTTTQLTASGTYSDGTTQDLTASVRWSSSSPNIVAISPGGVAQAKGVGTANVIAALGAVSGTQALTATAAALNAITVSSSQSLLPVGTTTKLTASGTYSDGTTQDLTAFVQWWSSSQQIVTISGAGVASAIAIGSAKVVATSGGVSGSALLAVSPAALVSVNVSPQNSLIPIGDKQQLSAIGSYTDGTTYDLTSYVSWDSDNAPVVAVDAHGVAFALNVGSANVQATYQAVVGTAAVTVQPQLNIAYFHLPHEGPDTTMRISNPGLSGTDLCAMIYVFDQKQQLVECCGCPVSLDGLLTLSLRKDLTANPLTGVKSTDGVVHVIAADQAGNPKCDASSITPSGILASWSTNLGSIGHGRYTVLEDSSASSPLSDQQLSASEAQCSFAKTLGSGQGTCSCGSGN